MENNNARYIAEFSGSDMIYHASAPIVVYATASMLNSEGDIVAEYSDFSEGLYRDGEKVTETKKALTDWLTDHFFDADLQPTTSSTVRDVQKYPVHICGILDRTIESDTGSTTKPVILYRDFARDAEDADFKYSLFESRALALALERFDAKEVLRRKFSGSMPRLGRPGEFFSLSATMSFARVRE